MVAKLLIASRCLAQMPRLSWARNGYLPQENNSTYIYLHLLTLVLSLSLYSCNLSSFFLFIKKNQTSLSMANRQICSSSTPTKDLTEFATSTNHHEPITNHESKPLLFTKFPVGLLGGARRTVGWLPWTPGTTSGINVNEQLLRNEKKCDQFLSSTTTATSFQLQRPCKFERKVDSTLLLYAFVWPLVIPKCVTCLVSLAVLGCWRSSLEILTAQHFWSLEALHRFRDSDVWWL